MGLVKQELFFKDDIKSSQIDELFLRVKSELDSGKIGYYHLPNNQSTILKEIETFINSKDLEPIKNIVILGVGGSSLGVKAIEAMLTHSKNRNDKRLIFLENVDPIEIEKRSRDLKLSNSLFILTSKSGSTIETTSILKYLLGKFELSCSDKKIKESFIFITDEDSPLDLWAKTLDIKTFHIPKNVGGRFSILSPVGLVPLALLGYEIKEILNGALDLKRSFFAKKEDQILKKAIYLVANEKNYPINVLFSYSSSLRYFNDWFVQLWAESLGKIDKNKKRRGLTPIGLIGSLDQHSFLQLIIEGVKNKIVTIIKIKNFQSNLKIPDIKLPNLSKVDFINNHTFQELINAQCDATRKSIIEQDIDLDLIEIDTLNEQSVGYMIYYYELLTSLCGILLEINTYDQPGVEYGKKILKEKFE